MNWQRTIPLTAAALVLVACSDQVPTEPVGSPSGLRPSFLNGGGGLTGAIFTSEDGCLTVNANVQYDSRQDVYLTGGPQNPSAGSGLPDGEYYVQVTEPNGTVLGTSVGSGNAKPFVVSGGSAVTCYQLWNLVIKASDGTQGYDATRNPGGEYKAWVSLVASFDNNQSKTDNFKVKLCVGPGCDPTPPALLSVRKFYDADADGVRDPGEVLLSGWRIGIQPFVGAQLIAHTTYSELHDVGFYTVSEFMPIQANWMATTPTSESFTLTSGGYTVTFGNLCVGAGGGHTLGFWSNKNGQAQMNDGSTLEPELLLLRNLNLRNANGSAFDPTAYATFRTWLLGATATNMAYMLSAQLAPMALNVEAGFVSGSAMIHAPGTGSANALGFASVSAIIAEADAELAVHGVVLAGSPHRALQEALKNALDRANNNLNFVQPTACPFTFPALPL